MKESVTTVEVAKTFDCNIGTIKEVRKWIVDVLSAQNAPNDVVNDVALAASEAVTNSVVHGYTETHEGRVDVRLQLSTGSILLIVRDYGTGLGRKPYAPPDINVPQEGGYGVFLIHRLMDEVRVVSRNEGTEVRMVKSINANPTP